ncbi:glucoside xylosyltransferase 1 [Syngnathoides biaculeatus]|uniref:glucoside xylosyltransferase 1 n=1 Tax=Syngnathoides biaculeatus TaxID=300417 RepID=UPI002ADDE4C8|nr:glucoside xylosyltransferase 1 [Syngnathoides biaculeatus]
MRRYIRVLFMCTVFAALLGLYVYIIFEGNVVVGRNGANRIFAPRELSGGPRKSRATKLTPTQQARLMDTPRLRHVPHGNPGRKQPAFRSVYEAIRKYTFGADPAASLLAETYCGKSQALFTKAPAHGLVGVDMRAPPLRRHWTYPLCHFLNHLNFSSIVVVCMLFFW